MTETEYASNIACLKTLIVNAKLFKCVCKFCRHSSNYVSMVPKYVEAQLNKQFGTFIGESIATPISLAGNSITQYKN